MRFLTISLLILLSSVNAYAVRTWANISAEDQVFLVNDLAIKNTDLTFSRSSQLKVTEVTLMSMINVYLFKVKADDCGKPKAVSELELYKVTSSSSSTTIGLELLKNCQMEIYVEKRDFQTPSLFNQDHLILKEFDLIIGIHSIVAAIKNPQRTGLKLYFTEEGKIELQKKGPLSIGALSNIETVLISKHILQERAKGYFSELGLEYQRVPSQTFLIADVLESKDVNWLYQNVENKDFKFLCLDQVTDVNNAAAILRTASFYNLDCVIIPKGNSFGLTPSFFRISSGAAEYIPVIQASSMAKLIGGLNDRGVVTIALSEHEDQELKPELIQDNATCLIVGKEDTGISHAVMRQAKYKLALHAKGAIKSLNVATAAAISMEKCFGRF